MVELTIVTLSTRPLHKEMTRLLRSCCLNRVCKCDGFLLVGWMFKRTFFSLGTCRKKPTIIGDVVFQK